MSVLRKTPLTFAITPPPSGVPIGTVVMWMGSTGNIPSGWLIANGAAFSASDYPDLYTALGVTNLPNMINRYPKFSTTAQTLGDPALPNITGYALSIESVGEIGGAFYYRYNNASGVGANDWGYHAGIGFNAARSSAVYGRSTVVETYHVTVIPLIKAA